jgi:hypothetical protein
MGLARGLPSWRWLEWLAAAGGGCDGPPNFGGLGLTCIEDLASWNIERGLSHFFAGLFHDANSLPTFKRMQYYVDAHEHVAPLKRARDVGLNLIQAKVLVSFQNQLPLVFFGKGAQTKTSSLNALKHDLDRALPSINNKQLQSSTSMFTWVTSSMRLESWRRGPFFLSTSCVIL